MTSLALIPFVCPGCGHRTEVPSLSVGSSIACPECKSIQPVLAPPPSKEPVTGDDKRLFVCTGCGYRARIPAQYIGKAVRCPNCDAAQIASGDEQSVRTGNTVSITRMSSSASTPSAKPTTIRVGNLLFTCSQCRFEAQLAQHYLGKAIRCPGCHAPQLVTESVTAQLPPGAKVPTPSPSAPTGDAIPAAPKSPTPTPPPADGDDQARFVCSACGYRARIPEHYVGLAVTCPSCEVVQIANAQATDQPSTGSTNRLAKLKTADPVEPSTTNDDTHLPFTCTACGFNTQVGSSLAGKAIRCPGCQATQIVPGTARKSDTQLLNKPSPIPAAMSAGVAPGSDKVRFTCSACNFKARIPAHYAGQVIHCPGCNAVQLVVASAPIGTSGNTRVLNKVETADAAKPATTGDELPSVSAALESAPARHAPPVTPPSAALTPVHSHPPVAKPATGHHPRPEVQPDPAPIARPATNRLTQPAAKDPAPPAPAVVADLPDHSSEFTPSTDPARIAVSAPPESALPAPTGLRLGTVLGLIGFILAVVIGLGLWFRNQWMLVNEQLAAARLETQQESRKRADAEQQRATAEQLRLEAETHRMDAEKQRLEAEKQRLDTEKRLDDLMRHLRDEQLAREAAQQDQKVAAPIPAAAMTPPVADPAVPAPAPAQAPVPTAPEPTIPK